MCSDTICSFRFKCQSKYTHIGTSNLEYLITKDIHVEEKKKFMILGFSVNGNYSTDLDRLFQKVNLKIVFRANYPSDLRIVESLFLFTGKPGIKSNESSFKLQTIGESCQLFFSIHFSKSNVSCTIIYSLEY